VLPEAVLLHRFLLVSVVIVLFPHAQVHLQQSETDVDAVT